MSEKWSKPHAVMDLVRNEETVILAAALTKVALNKAPVDIFGIDKIGVSSDPDVAADFGTDVDEWTDWSTLDDTTDKYAQSFKAGHTDVLTVKLYLKAANSFAGTLAVGIYTDSGGDPNTIVGTQVTKTDANISTTKSLHTFTFTDVTGLTADSTYWIVISLTARTAGNVVVYGNAGTSSSYADGTAQNYRTDTWYENANGDIWFEVKHTPVAIADAAISAIVQKLATDGQVTLGASEDDNCLIRVTYTTLEDADLDAYLDTYTSFIKVEDVENAIGADPRRFWFTLGMLVQKGKVEVSHGLVQNDPSAGETTDSGERTIKNLCIDIDNLYVKGA